MSAVSRSLSSALLVLTIATHIGLWGMFRLLQKYETQKEQTQHRSPLAPTADERLPPEPRLQGAPGFAEESGKAAPGQHEEREDPDARAKDSTRQRIRCGKSESCASNGIDVLEHGPTDEHGQRFGMPIEQAKEEVLKQLPAEEAVSSEQWAGEQKNDS